jgi:hypothetical protein
MKPLPKHLELELDARRVLVLEGVSIQEEERPVYAAT